MTLVCQRQFGFIHNPNSGLTSVLTVLSSISDLPSAFVFLKIVFFLILERLLGQIPHDSHFCLSSLKVSFFVLLVSMVVVRVGSQKCRSPFLFNWADLLLKLSLSLYTAISLWSVKRRAFFLFTLGFSWNSWIQWLLFQRYWKILSVYILKCWKYCLSRFVASPSEILSVY